MPLWVLLLTWFIFNYNMNVWNWGEDINLCIATSLIRLHMSVVKKSQCVTNVGTLHHIPHANHFYEIIWPIGVKINRIRFNDNGRFVINVFHCGWLAFTALKHQDLRGLSVGGRRWWVVVTVQSGFCEQYVTIFHPMGSGLDLPVRTRALVHGLLPDAQNYLCPGNARNFSHYHGLAIPTCISACASRSCRDACRER